MKTYQIHFIRHGLTDGNLTGKYIGGTDSPLCEKGEKDLISLSSQHTIKPFLQRANGCNT